MFSKHRMHAYAGAGRLVQGLCNGHDLLTVVMLAYKVVCLQQCVWEAICIVRRCVACAMLTV